MAGASASEIIFISVNHSITLMGKVWLIVTLFLRILILLLAGFPLYQDEQERFVCNTLQPGCANVCYDLFSPISLFRFWLVQLVAVSLPYLIFLVYVVHKVSNGFAADLGNSSRAHAETPLVAERFTGAYVLHLAFRTLLEAGFGAAHYYLFGFYIPRRFLCQQPPCTTQVDCYISRPTEKSVMLNFMLGAAALSLLLDVLDFLCAIKRSVRQTSKRKVAGKRRGEERGFPSSKNGSNPSGQQDSEVEAGPVFRKRQISGGGVLVLPHEPASSCSPGSPGCNTNGNNGYSVSQEEAPERNGSEVALCPPEPLGTPRSIRVSKRNRVKPPPPPRSDPAVPPGASLGPGGDVPKSGTRRVGQFTLVELGLGSGEFQGGDDGPDKRSEWV